MKSFEQSSSFDTESQDEVQTKHTPGPWRYVKTGPNHWIMANAGNVAFIGGKDTIFTTSPNMPHEANGNLIAQAPTLLAERDRLREENKRLKAGLRKLRHWPRKSVTVDGNRTSHVLECLANVRRCAGDALGEYDEETKAEKEEK